MVTWVVFIQTDRNLNWSIYWPNLWLLWISLPAIHWPNSKSLETGMIGLAVCMNHCWSIHNVFWSIWHVLVCLDLGLNSNQKCSNLRFGWNLVIYLIIHIIWIGINLSMNFVYLLNLLLVIGFCTTKKCIKLFWLLMSSR